MPNTNRPPVADERQTDFGEYLSAYMDTPTYDESHDMDGQSDVRTRFLRQLGFVVGLLVIQLIIFFGLITYLLGFSL